jgi:hypothetical protein
LAASHHSTFALERCAQGYFVSLLIAMAFTLYITRSPAERSKAS